MSGTVLRRDAVLEVGDRLQEIRFGQVGDVRVLRLAPARSAGGSSRTPTPAACDPADDRRHGWMVFRMPVRRREEIADLRQRVGHVGARHTHLLAVIRRRDVVGQVGGIGPVRRRESGRIDVGFRIDLRWS